MHNKKYTYYTSSNKATFTPHKLQSNTSDVLTHIHPFTDNYINVRTGAISVIVTVAVDFQLSLKFSKFDSSPGGASLTSNST